jgi:hypothetical protein
VKILPGKRRKKVTSGYEVLIQPLSGLPTLGSCDKEGGVLRWWGIQMCISPLSQPSRIECMKKKKNRR